MPSTINIRGSLEVYGTVVLGRGSSPILLNRKRGIILYHQYNDKHKKICYDITIRKKTGHQNQPGKENTMNRINNTLSYLYSYSSLSLALSKGLVVVRSYRDNDKVNVETVM